MSLGAGDDLMWVLYIVAGLVLKFCTRASDRDKILTLLGRVESLVVR